jgi:hypothetical protein
LIDTHHFRHFISFFKFKSLHLGQNVNGHRGASKSENILVFT